MKLHEIAKICEGFSHFSNDEIEKIKKNAKDSKGINALKIINCDGTEVFIDKNKIKKLVPNWQNEALPYQAICLFRPQGGQSWEIKIIEDNLNNTLSSKKTIIIEGYNASFYNYIGYPQNKRHFLRKINSQKEKNAKSIIRYLKEEVQLPQDFLERHQNDESERLGLNRPLSSADLPIQVAQKPVTMISLIKRYEVNALVLNSDFQRLPNLWKTDVKSRFIESLIAGIPVPAFYFYAEGDENDTWQVIDGLQRLSAVTGFVNNAFALEGLDFLERLEGKKFKELSPVYQRKIEEYDVFAYILDSKNAQSVRYKIFKNINSGSLKLERQEIRHTLSPGEAAAGFLKKISDTTWFQEYVPITEGRRKRMYDREIILRFIALYELFNPEEEYTPEMPDFLDTAMQELYTLGSEEREVITKKLKETLHFIHSLFETPCFSRSFFEGEDNYTHNNIIFELLSVTFAKQHFELLEANKEAVRNACQTYFSEKKRTFWENAYTKKNFEARFYEFKTLILNTLQK